MPVRKFKTFQEAEEALWEFKPDDVYYAKVQNLFQLAAKLLPPKNRKGILKYTSIQHASEHNNPYF